MLGLNNLVVGFNNISSSKIPEAKWQEVRLAFITYLPRTQSGIHVC